MRQIRARQRARYAAWSGGADSGMSVHLQSVRRVWQAGPVAKPPVMQPTSADVRAFLDAVPNETRRADAKVLCELLGEVTGEPPVLWGPSIVGFGTLHYRYESGREGRPATRWVLTAEGPSGGQSHERVRGA